MCMSNEVSTEAKMPFALSRLECCFLRPAELPGDGCEWKVEGDGCEWKVEGDGCEWKVEEEEVGRRRDLRETHLVFSIDPQGCEDVDDTLSVRSELSPSLSFSLSSTLSSALSFSLSSSLRHLYYLF